MEGESEETRTLEILAPFLSREMLVELCSGRRWQTYKERRKEWMRWRRARAMWAQKQIAREMAQYQTRYVDGLGQLKMVVDPELRAIAEIDYGKGCWNDPDFKTDTYKKTPEVRVPIPKSKFIVVP